MYHLVYISTARTLFTDDDLESILLKSRRNNALHSITGMLLYHDGVILQVLEGDKAFVQELMRHISHDPRHYGIQIIMDGEAADRYFSDWSMGFRRISAKDWNQIEGYLSVSALAVGNATSPAVDHQELLAFIRSFCTINFGR